VYTVLRRVYVGKTWVNLNLRVQVRKLPVTQTGDSFYYFLTLDPILPK